MNEPLLSILECRSCGAVFWFPIEQGGACAGGPCCKGLPIMDIDRFPTERAAIKVYPAWLKARDRALKAQLDAISAGRMREAA